MKNCTEGKKLRFMVSLTTDAIGFNSEIYFHQNQQKQYLTFVYKMPSEVMKTTHKRRN